MGWQPADDLLVHLRALLDERGREGWRVRAACKGASIDLFFPPGEGWGKSTARYDSAREVCRDCPVTFQCAEAAIEQGEDFGCWGSTSPGERRAIRAADRRYRAMA